MTMIPAGAVLVLLISLPVTQEDLPGGAQAGGERLDIALRGGRIEAHIENCTLDQVVEELKAKTQVAIVLAGDIAADRITADLRDVTLDAGLHHLFAAYDLFLYYGGPAGNTPASVRRVWIYPRGQGGQLRPVPPAEWASTKDLEASLAQSDPEVRAQAYEAMMENPDPGRRNLVVQALGGGEPSDQIRERILASAMSKGFPLSADLLGDLVQTDRSEQIRWMALDALSHDASGKRIAEQALNDVSQTVREKAKEILATQEPPPGGSPETPLEGDVQR